MELTCPKCQGTMRTYERNGVHVDQCQECRGIFLDRGELERIVDAEGNFYEQRERYEEPRHEAPRHEPPRYEHRDYRHKPHKRHKRESFLGELFDIG